MLIYELEPTRLPCQFGGQVNRRYNTYMRKKLEHGLKAEKREIKKRPRMKVHGVSLKRTQKHAGLAIIKKRKI